MPPFDPHWARTQFPALAQKQNGQPLIFFDGPGGTQVPQHVIDAMSDYLIRSNANTHGAFVTSARTDEVIESAHAAMADLLGCDPDEIAFGPNMTTLTFALSRSMGREWQAGDEMVVTRLDHDANVAPWLALKECGAVIRFVDIDIEDCTLDMADFERQINERTRLVAVGYASNAVGTVNNVARVVELAHQVGALVFIDAVHYAPHGPIDVRVLDCDFLACSPYKFFAPHMGTLYGKREHLTNLQPYKVRPASNAVPDRWESGTKNHEGLAGVTAAIDYLAELGSKISDPTPTSRRDALRAAMTTIQEYERTLSERLVAGLRDIPGLTLYGITDPDRFDQRTPTVSIRIEGYTPRELATALGQRNICTWDGHYYAINLTERLGVEASGGMVRIGLVHYNTVEEIDQLVAALHELTS
ncbi:MAG: cysteine desulfurase-like protein [Chloroflexi bacterium AL-W]|nr:cysteine desulfurase-like protein [Chloroflexi bacterium AL-N1]NOK68708.1 cysteine desulfurase-like protein [Chloroflexi bacterium AL-N10]NOK76194.1 cysteine desulfurase-like protein [Chloroflexi bacterium AL-N5]NOK84169.1 cysteine desulfurase-like protein [Chloroflexi bacterium AL-W]NOK91332.1 cysteine desulfurase-like protein [Chloroflexi bacterium AL-N15]